MSAGETFADQLVDTTETTGSILSLGYDPAPVDFPHRGISGYDSELPNPAGEYNGAEVRDELVEYFHDVSQALQDEGASPAAFKPNLGYFLMYDDEDGYWGSEALDEVIGLMRDTADVPIILDAKDADIARSSAAYAISKLKKDVDAMTVHPEMGHDSVGPFFEFASDNGQGVYVLTRTTNPGAEDFQNLQVVDPETGEQTELYNRIADEVIEWGEEYPGTVASVVAANNIPELRDIVSRFADADARIPTLLPGVGTQGGEADEVMDVLEEVGYDPRLARINSSSGIMYRAQKDDRPREEHAEASAEEVQRLNREMDVERFLEGGR